ncbi:MAG: hypothetical protein AAB393_02250, partial [Bacteroidota bacterium]
MFEATSDFGTNDMFLDEVIIYEKGPAYSGALTLPGTFGSFTEAARRLRLFGVSGPTTIDVAAGVYADSVTFPPIPGASATNTITFQNSEGIVTVQRAGVLAQSTTQRTDDAVISLWGADYMTFNGINISGLPGSTNNEWGYHVRAITPTDGANYNTIQNCQIVMSKTNTTTRGIRHFPFWVLTAAAGASSNNHYYNNDIQSCGFQGILLQGQGGNTGGTIPYFDFNNEIGSVGGGTARFFDIGGGSGSANAVAMTGQNGSKIFKCDIDSIWVTSGTANAIILGTGTTGGDSLVNYEVYGNQIRRIVQTAGTASTILTAIRVPGNSNSSRGRIYNNFVSNLRSNGTSTTTAIAALYHQGNTNVNTLVEWYFNTVLLDNPAGTTGNNAVVRIDNNVTMRNNVFVNKSTVTSGKNYIYRRTAGTVTANNNALYVDTTVASGFVGFHVSDQKSLPAWQAASGADGASAFENPDFVNSTSLPYDLHLEATTPTQIES